MKLLMTELAPTYNYPAAKFYCRISAEVEIKKFNQE